MKRTRNTERLSDIVREAAKKVIFLVAGPLRGGGAKWCVTKVKKELFLCKEKTSFNMFI